MPIRTPVAVVSISTCFGDGCEGWDRDVDDTVNDAMSSLAFYAMLYNSSSSLSLCLNESIFFGIGRRGGWILSTLNTDEAWRGRVAERRI